MANPIPDQSATEDSAFSFTVPADTFEDVDADTLTYTTSTLPGWLTFNAGTFSGTPTSADVGTLSVTVTADDGNGGTATDTFDIVIANGNAAPTVANADRHQSATEDSAFSFTVPADTFADVDADTLTYTTSTLPGWLTFNAGTFSGTPGSADVGTLASPSRPMTATVAPPPIPSTSSSPTATPHRPWPIRSPTQSATEDSAFSFTVPADTFEDVDADTLTYTTSTLPGWLTFNAGTFSGTPGSADVGTLSVTVTADDGNGGTATDTFDIVIANGNAAPTVANPIATQSATEDSAFSFTVPADTLRTSMRTP